MSPKKYPEKRIVVPRFREENGFYTTPERSALMGRIKSKNSKAEVRLRKALWNMGIRYRKNVVSLPGIPDIVIRKYRLIIFVDGDFWHGYNWEKEQKRVKKNRDFWLPKIERNIQHDAEINHILKEEGWHVIRLWDHEIRKEMHRCVSRISDYIKDYTERFPDPKS